MCGRYTLTDPNDLAARFGLGAISETRLEPRFNIALSQLAPIIVAGEEGRSLERMRWGFKPAWMKAFRQPPPINARAETGVPVVTEQKITVGAWAQVWKRRRTARTASTEASS